MDCLEIFVVCYTVNMTFMIIDIFVDIIKFMIKN